MNFMCLLMTLPSSVLGEHNHNPGHKLSQAVKMAYQGSKVKILSFSLRFKSQHATLNKPNCILFQNQVEEYGMTK